MKTMKTQNFVFLQIRMPFDWRTPYGYLPAWLVQSLVASAESILIAQFLNFDIGNCWLFIFIAEDITNDLATFNTFIKATSNGSIIKLTEHFCDLIQIYSDAKQWVEEEIEPLHEKNCLLNSWKKTTKKFHGLLKFLGLILIWSSKVLKFWLK